MSDHDAVGSRRLEVYQLAHALGLRLHAMTMRLPRFEFFEEGAQIRKSSKSVSSLIVEGYRLRKSRDEFLHYLNRAAGSADESREHLDYLHQTGSLKDPSEYTQLKAECERLLGKLIRFIQGVARNHSRPFYLVDSSHGTPAEPQSRVADRNR